jgi:hypothetical protein
VKSTDPKEKFSPKAATKLPFDAIMARALRVKPGAKAGAKGKKKK